MTKSGILTDYVPLLDSIKVRIRRAQVRATLSANAQMLHLYWDVGRTVADRQNAEGWGAKVIPRLAADIKNDMPEVKGFSASNIKRMIQFYREYPLLSDWETETGADTSSLNHSISPQAVGQLPESLLNHLIRQQPVAKLLESLPNQSILQQPVAKLPESLPNHSISPQAVAQLPSFSPEQPISPTVLAKISSAEEIRLEVLQKYAFLLPWGHHVLLMEKIKEFSVRLWYMKEAVEQSWTRDTLAAMIKKDTYNRQGKAVTNFSLTLPPLESEAVQQLLRDPYIFDFLTLEEPFREKELENALAENLQKFLLELGHGFAFIGRQYHIEVSDRDYYLDLLFYHLDLRRFIVIELKRGEFQPEYAGKVNFYCSAVDDLLRRPGDAATLGLILCQEKDKIIAEYSLRRLEQPIGVSEYELTRTLPESFRSALPSIEQIETEFAQRFRQTTQKSTRQNV
ncbi:MAG: PDDEXK nuclease domain-containing protein [Planctomycetaceae bacterium]|nr:PDDEXK nuclease domain-containing protein [Planctomycetaceae bacterium]